MLGSACPAQPVYVRVTLLKRAIRAFGSVGRIPRPRHMGRKPELCQRPAHRLRQLPTCPPEAATRRPLGPRRPVASVLLARPLARGAKTVAPVRATASA